MDRRFVRISVIFFFLSSLALAAPFRTTYQAKIIKPDGQPLQSSSVNFRFTILDPSASCALYVEDYTAVNMNDTAGLVAFSLGAGVRSFPSSGTAATFSNTFDNSITSFACQTPGVYLPISTDNRKIVMQFNDGTGWQTLPAMTINAVPYSMYAGKSENSIQLNGKSDTAFVEYSTLAALNCQSNEAIKFNGVSFSCLTVGGSVTSGSVISALGYTPADGASVTALSSNVSVVSSTVFSVSSTVSSLAGSLSSLQSSVAASFAAITSMQSLNGSISATQSFAIGAGGIAPSIVTNNGVHTFNIPYAASSSVTGGLLSNVDYTTFTNKLNATSAAVITALGYSPADTSTVGSSFSAVTTNVSNLSTSMTTLNSTVSSLSSSVGAIVSSQWNTSGTDISYSAGNVGIGTAVPAYNLDIDVKTADMRIKNTGTAGYPVQFMDSYSDFATWAGAALIMRRARGTEASPTYVNSGDSLGYIAFRDHLGGGGALIGTMATEAHSSTAKGTALIFQTNANTVVAATEKMRIDHNGNVGIGTTAPTALLHLKAGTTTNAPLKFTSGTLLTSPQSGTMEYDGANFYLTDSTNTRRTIATGSSQGSIDNVSNINSSSNITMTPNGSVIVSATTASTNTSTGALVVKGGVGIAGDLNVGGSVSMASSLTVSGNINGNGNISTGSNNRGFWLDTAGSFNYGIWRDSTDNVHIRSGGTTERITITSATGSVGIGTASPAADLTVLDKGGANERTLGIDGTAGTNRELAFMTNGTSRWIMGEDNLSESGSNAGSNFYLNAYSDAGAYLNTNFFINRASGNVGIGTIDPTLGISFSSSNRLLAVEASGVSGSTLSGGLILANGGTLADTYELGHINFVGRQNGVNLDNVMARITSRANGSGGTDGFGATLQFFTKPDNTDGGALERMRIDAAGNIGVATTSPLTMVPGWTPNSNQKLLSITGNASASTNANGLLVLANNRATPTGGDQLGAVVFASTNNNGHIPAYVDGVLAGSGGANGFGGILRFHTKPDNVSAPVERVRINSEGNVGIGTGSPIGKLHLVDESNVTPRNLIIDNFTVTGGNASQIWGRTARGTAQSPTATQAGDPLLNLIGASYDGSSFNEVGHVRVLAESNQSTSAHDGFIEFSTTTGTTQVERMRITSTGNVGIGTSSPSGKLNVVGDWNGSYGAVTLQGDKPTIRFSSTSGTIGGGNHWLIHQGNSDPSNVGSLDFFQSTDGVTWGTAKLKIAPNGNVGIGTTTPREQLATNGNVKVGTGSGASSNFVQITGHHENSVTGGYGSGFRLQFNSSSDLFMISREWSGWNNDPNLVIARSSGNVGIGTGSPSYKLDVSGTIRGFGITDSSDIRLKKDIAPLDFSLEKLLQIKGVSYHWKDKAMPKKQIGFIAQDLEKIYPELVETDQNGMKSVNYSHLVAPLVEGFKSLYEKVMVLFDRNEQLAREVAAVKAENAEKTKQLNDIRAYLCSKDPNAPMCK